MEVTEERKVGGREPAMGTHLQNSILNTRKDLRSIQKTFPTFHMRKWGKGKKGDRLNSEL